MGRHLELGHLSEEECERILQVMQRDFDLRQKEKGRLNKIEEEIKEEDSKVSILAKQKNFNDNCCMRCFSRFIFIFNQKVQCLQCEYYICKSCAVYNSTDKKYICHVCRRQRELEAKKAEMATQSCEWFYSNIKEKFKRFGSAKVVRSLYKRKTDSDSENDSGYDPSQYSNSLPVGKRTRRTIEGFFADLSTPQATQDGPQEEQSEEAREAAITENFHIQLNSLVDDIHKILENNPTSPQDLADSTPDKYSGVLGAQRHKLCTALSQLALSLQGTGQGTSENSEKDVDQTVIEEVEKYVGHPVSLGDATSKRTEPEDWDPLAAAILHKVVAARWEADERLHQREEEKVRRDLTKLSNQVHISQLNELLVSDSDIDTHNSTFADTDNESHFSEQPDSDVPVTSTPRYDLQNGYGVHETIVPNGYMALNSQPNRDSDKDSDIDLDDLVALNTNDALTVRAQQQPVRMSVSSADSSDMLITITSPDGETFTAPGEHARRELEELAAVKHDAKPIVVSRQVTERLDSSCDSDATIGADSDSPLVPNDTPVQEPLLVKQLVTREHVMPEMDDLDDDLDGESILSEEAAQRLEAGRSVPLPSLDDNTSSLGLDEVDFDDISRYGDDEDDNNNTTLDSEILLGQSWDVTQPGPLFKDRISAYDNFGERKIGKDQDGPLLMFVPPSDVSTATVGERDLEELSDLSENEEGSQTLSDLLSDSDLEADEQGHSRVKADFPDQPEDMEDSRHSSMYQMFSPATPETLAARTRKVKTLTTEQIELLRQKKLQEAEEAADQAEDDPEDADPRFIVRPVTVTIPEGEPARFTCQVTGTKPLDVFWYKEDSADVRALEEDPNTEIYTHDDRHTLEVFNTTPTSRGRYVCIAINEKGRNHKPFRLVLTESHLDKAAPEFLKPITDAEVLEGTGASFRCKVKGRPQPHITWYKDGQRLTNSTQYRIQKLGNRDYVLNVDYATLDDDAEYSVIARNVVGEACATAQLLVEAKTDETSKKYADREEMSVAQVTTPRAGYPDTAELLRIAEQVHSSRTLKSSPAGTPVHSTAKLSSINNQIDEMDKKLNTLEDEVHQSMIHRSDSTYSDDSATYTSSFTFDMPVTNSLRESILREHDETQSTAQSMRHVTSAALEVLTSSDTLMKATRDIETANESKTTKSESTPEGSRQTVVISPAERVPVNTDDIEEELLLCYADFEMLYDHGAISKEQLKSGKVKRKDGQRLLSLLEELKVQALEEKVEKGKEDSPNSLLTSIDCGLKRVPSKRYKRDYIINRSPQTGRKKYGVNGTGGLKEGDSEHDLNDAEESIYVASGRVSSTEERIRELQRKVSGVDVSRADTHEADDDVSDDEDLAALEDQVSRAVATVTQTERQVSKIEKQVSNLQQRARGSSTSSQSESPTHQLHTSQSDGFELQPCSPTGEVQMDKSMESHDVPHDDNVGLPSVKNLRSMFNVDDGQGVRRKQPSNMVYSLTGRDLPRTVREKLRDQGPDVMPSSNIRGIDDTRKRQSINQVFSTPSSREEKRPSSFHEETGPLRSSTPRGTPAQPTPSLRTSPTATSPISPTSSNQSATSPDSSSTGRSSTIMARAAFWDTRILEGKVSDRELKEADFPTLPEETFKSDDEDSMAEDPPATSTFYEAQCSWDI